MPTTASVYEKAKNQVHEIARHLLNLPKKGHGYREALMRSELHGALDSRQEEMKERC